MVRAPAQPLGCILTVQGGDHGSGTNTETSNETTNEDGSNVSAGGGLHDGADDSEDGCEDEVVAAADFVGNDTSAKSTNETATLQGGDNVGLKVRKCNTFQPSKTISPTNCQPRVSLLKVTSARNILFECVQGQDASDDTRVNTEQHTTETCLCLSAGDAKDRTISAVPSMPKRTHAIRKSPSGRS